MVNNVKFYWENHFLFHMISCNILMWKQFLMNNFFQQGVSAGFLESCFKWFFKRQDSLRLEKSFNKHCVCEALMSVWSAKFIDWRSVFDCSSFPDLLSLVLSSPPPAFCLFPWDPTIVPQAWRASACGSAHCPPLLCDWLRVWEAPVRQRPTHSYGDMGL